MRLFKMTRVLAGVAAVALLVNPSVLKADTNEELLQRVRQLEEQVRMLLDAREDKSGVTPAVVAATGKSGGKKEPKTNRKELDFKIGSTRIGYGGYIKLDTIFSEYSGGESAAAPIGEDFLVASTIPVGGEGGDAQFQANAKASRFYFSTTTPTETGQIGTRIEMDYYGSHQGNEVVSNSYASRLRHAYVNWQIDDRNALLGGQSWSTFQNPGVLPDTLDFIGPVGTIFNRQAQIRYTRKLAAGEVQVSLENPSTSLYPGGGIANTTFDDNVVPNLVARFNRKTGNFSYSLAATVREIAYEGGGMDEAEYGGALSFAGKWALGEDDIRFMFNAGNGLGRYMGVCAFRDGQIMPDGSIELIPQYGGFVAYRHVWNDKLRSSFVASAIYADNPASAAAATPEAYQSLHLNLVYQPLPKLTFGGEYIWARRQDEGLHGEVPDDEGSLNRIQATMKYSF